MTYRLQVSPSEASFLAHDIDTAIGAAITTCLLEEGVHLVDPPRSILHGLCSVGGLNEVSPAMVCSLFALNDRIRFEA